MLLWLIQFLTCSGGDLPSEEVALQPFVEVTTSEQQTAPSVAAAAAVTPPGTADEESAEERNIDPNSKVLNDLVLVMLMLQTRFTKKS